jgi:predicted enzyme related to lactoylglutathione lyase
MTTSSSIGATGIDAVYYLAKDFQRAIAFYRDVIGLKPSIENEQMVEFDAGGTSFGLSHMPGVWYQSGGVMFGVPDIQEAESRLKSAGVRFMTPVMETPVCHVAWCQDSEDNYFAIHQRK